ncbi:granulocyte-macrophage colony-stimulating factor receptor subunit alpha-like isoform X2 [Pteropus medius]|uniref:granulocyte-macrophage colony-stimulating factor receptor subunit alpha-like isoform X2 n=1 Tax=Pteropus vampyrus TaxID=132908 RepID=UPI00196AB91A|nr:granulocyte-macrophage colony-stimulating factor receptor subunit alpha-like isoform X2 [Pteropus giganteus]
MELDTMTLGERGRHGSSRCATPSTWRPRTREAVSADNTYFCLFPNSVLHRGATLTVNVTADGDVFEHVLAFENPGPDGSAAGGFSCLIYSLRRMNCSWTPGPAAPADVRYRLFAWTDPHDDEVECPHYLLDSKGTRVGCHFDKLAEPKRTDNYFFLVNGTSKHTAIQFVDFTPFKAVQMGKTMSRLPWSPAVPGASRVPRCVSLCSWTAWGWHAGARE